jgi:hypothetical protein
MFRRFRSLVAAGVLAFACAALFAAPAGSAMTFGTHLYLSKKFPAFHGKVHSAVHFCEAKRKVKLFVTRPGNDKLLGVDTSEGNGHWKVNISNQLASGVYYARTPAFGSAALGISCRADRSRIAVVD